jgi:hypothetical protein
MLANPRISVFKTLEVYREFLGEMVSSKYLALLNTFLEAAPQANLQYYLILVKKKMVIGL